MQAKIVLFLIVIFSNLVFSQDKIIYLDSLNREVSETNYQIKRVILDYNSNKNEYKVFEYNQDGKILSEGNNADKNTTKKIGAYTSYYLNGNKKEVVNYSEFKVIGKHEQWYENGNKKLEGEYVDAPFGSGKDYKIIQFWDEYNIHKVVDGNGEFHEKDKFINYKGKIKNGYRDGVWNGTYEDKYKITEEFEAGKFIFGESSDETSTVKYSQIEQTPEPVDGINHFYKYIGNNFNYTKSSIKNNIKGKIFIKYVVEKDGKITDVKVMKGLGHGLDEEAVRVISSYKNWIPGKQRGRNVRFSYSIPINLSGY